ncbi:MAG TPA: hypothetical protein VI456_17295 [Polyangia bacterium]
MAQTRPGIRIVGEISQVELIASGRRIRELARLEKVYGAGRWRKLQGVARVVLSDGGTTAAEVHWYEGHGLGRRELKIKRLLEDQS